MRGLLLMGSAALALSACGSGNNANNSMNATAADNMMYEENAATMNAGGMDANMATNAATENAMMNDLTHNDVDTNLANGQ